MSFTKKIKKLKKSLDKEDLDTLEYILKNCKYLETNDTRNIWIDANGKRIWMDDMSQDHLKNAKKRVEKDMKDYVSNRQSEIQSIISARAEEVIEDLTSAYYKKVGEF